MSVNPSADGSPASTRLLCRWLPAVVFVLTFLAFQPALKGHFLNWDDEEVIVRNGHVHGLSGAHLKWMFTHHHMGHYHPLTWLSYGIDYELGDLKPWIYHLTNVLLHSINAVLFFFVLLRLLEKATPSSSSGDVLPLSSALGAIFFALHPLRAESVAWVTERRDVLSGCFFLLSLLAYLRMVDSEGPSRRRWYVACVICLGLSLLAKAWAITLPLVLIVLDVWPLRRWGRSAFLEKLPLMGLAMAAAGAAVWAQSGSQAAFSLSDYTLGQRFAQAFQNICFYLWKTAAPLRLSPLYLLNIELNPRDPAYLLCGAAVLGATVVMILARKRIPWALTAWLCYLVILSPVLGLFQSGSQMAADRYTYLSCLPWAVLIAAAAARAAAAGRGWAAIAIGALTTLAIGSLTFAQTLIWKDSVSLWTQAVRVDPQNFFARTLLAGALINEKNYRSALDQADKAVAIRDNFPAAYRERGIARRELGDADGAIADFTTALRLQPGEAGLYFNRAIAMQRKGEVRGALNDLDATLRLDPDYIPAYMRRALLRYLAHDLAGCIEDYDRWIAADPRSAEAHAGRAAARQDLGDVTGAIQDYEKALALAPAAWPARKGVEQALEKARELRK